MQFREQIVTPVNNIIRSANYRLDDITISVHLQLIRRSDNNVIMHNIKKRVAFKHPSNDFALSV